MVRSWVPRRGRSRSWVPLQGQSRRRALAGAGVIALVLGAGVGGYLIGSSSSEDLEAAGRASAVAGERKGSAQGARAGYARGLESGRRRGYANAYPEAYKAAYLAQFQDAGLDAPVTVSVPKPQAAQGAKR